MHLGIKLLVFFLLVGIIIVFFMSTTSHYTLQLKIRDEHGAPLSGAKATFFDSAGNTLYSTNLNNSVSFSTSHKNIIVSVEKEGYASFTKRISLSSKPTQLTVQLKRGQTISTNIPKGRYDFLIISNYNRLSSKYGSSVANAISIEMQALANSVENIDNLKSAAIFIDSPHSMKSFDMLPISCDGDNSCRPKYLEAIRELISKNNAKYVLLVGSDYVVPFQKVPNPLKFSNMSKAFNFVLKEDPYVFSDLPYASDTCHPKIAIGRILSGNEKKLEGDNSLIILLRNARKQHIQTSNSQIVKFVSADSDEKYLAHLSFELSPNKPIISPPFFVVHLMDLYYFSGSLAELQSYLKRGDVLFLSLHGSNPPGEEALVGKSFAAFLVLNPWLVEEYNLNGKVLITDSCYGGHPRKKKYFLPTSALLQGAKVFVGSTATAFSGTSYSGVSLKESDIPSIGSSNAFTYYFMKSLYTGKNFGQSFNFAKSVLDCNRPIDNLTAYEYELYGDPTLKLSH